MAFNGTPLVYSSKGQKILWEALDCAPKFIFTQETTQ